MKKTIKWIGCIAALTGVGLAGIAAQAAELKIGFKAEITRADPQTPDTNNRNVWAHVYEPLVSQDENLRPKPALALSWKAVNPTTWEFKLRPNVTFHNGEPFTARDVQYSIERAMNLSGPRTLRSYLRDVASVAVINPMTVQIKTKTVSPILPDNISVVPMLPASLGANATEQAFETGKTAIGTGPYKFVEWLHGQHVVLARNDAYWGSKEPWNKVIFQFLPKEPSRAASLVSGTVDVIDAVSSNMMDAFRGSNKVDTVSLTSYTLNYLSLDRLRDDSPYIKDNDGKPLKKNPFNELRVRQALLLAVNRDGIIKQIMKGDAESAGQVVPPGFFGHHPNLKAPAFDIAKAKALLAEAGYPDGFRLTLHCSQDHYLNDAKMCEALGQSFTQIGVKTEVKTFPFAVFRPRSINGGPNGTPEFSLIMLGIGAVTGDSIGPLVAVAHGQQKTSGLGANNYSGYSNKEVDALIDKASSTMDERAREDIQKSAVQKLIDDVGIIPIIFPKASWAFKKGITLKPRSDGFTLAMNIRPAQ
jgi:peptide/nickel transport system substrate-binding protein